MNRALLTRIVRPVGSLVLLAALLMPVLPAQVVRAATVTVTANSVDAVHNPGCATDGATAPCSLRDAVLYANTSPGTVITIPAGTYTLTIVPTGGNDANSGDLNTANDTTITGAGAASTIIQASATDSSTGIDRVFTVGGGTLTVRGVTIRNGKAASDGGGIFVNGDCGLDIADSVVSGNAGTGVGAGITFSGAVSRQLTIANTIVSGNTISAAGVGYGGGIYIGGGTATITNSAISGNHLMGVSGGGGGGGGIANPAGTVSITNTTIGNNTTDGFGGGIETESTLTVNASAITGNTAGLYGGGIENNGTLTVTNTTVSGNAANGASGGGIDSQIKSGFPGLTVIQSTIANNSSTRTGGGIAGSSPMIILGTIVASNSGTSTAGAYSCPGATDVCGAFTSQGYNFIGKTDGSSGFGGTDLTGTTATPRDPLVGPLQNNGGPTQTHALKVHSPAIDTIPAANHCGTSNTAVDTDQRGINRPFGTACDMGAVEFAFSTTPNSGPTTGGSKLTLSGAGFVPGMTVSLGGSTCTNVAVNGTGTSATCTTTVHAAGAVGVSMTFSGQTRTLASGYTYGAQTPLPAVAPQGSPVGSPGVMPVRLPTGGGQGAPASLPNPRP